MKTAVSLGLTLVEYMIVVLTVVYTLYSDGCSVWSHIAKYRTVRGPRVGLSYWLRFWPEVFLPYVGSSIPCAHLLWLTYVDDLCWVLLTRAERFWALSTWCIFSSFAATTEKNRQARGLNTGPTPSRVEVKHLGPAGRRCRSSYCCCGCYCCCCVCCGQCY